MCKYIFLNKKNNYVYRKCRLHVKGLKEPLYQIKSFRLMTYVPELDRHQLLYPQIRRNHLLYKKNRLKEEIHEKKMYQRVI